MGATEELLATDRHEAKRAALLEQTWAGVRDVVADQADVVDGAALALLTPGSPFEPANAVRMAHRLAGSLGSFGLPAASDDAHELEMLFGGMAGAEPDSATTLRIADLAVGLREHIAYLDRSFTPSPSLDGGEADAAPARPVADVIDLRAQADGSGLSLVDVAVVEDDPVTAELVVHALRQTGISTKVLSDGAAAAEALGGRVPSLRARVVLLDVDLPSLNGLDVLRSLRRRGTLEHTKVIMLTARCGESETIEAFDLGAIDHVAKPFSHSVLVRRVKLALV